MLGSHGRCSSFAEQFPVSEKDLFPRVHGKSKTVVCYAKDLMTVQCTTSPSKSKTVSFASKATNIKRVHHVADPLKSAKRRL